MTLKIPYLRANLLARLPLPIAARSRLQGDGRMSRILAIHGAAPNVDRQRFEFQNISDRDVLRRFLSSVPPFVPLADALAGRGDALTIDDATRAAFDAALLAREYGHAVSVFINPEAVESGAPYWFTLLLLLLDRLDPTGYAFENINYPTSTRAERRALREPIKASCRTIRDEPSRVALVRRLAERWQVQPLEVPHHLETLRKADLVTLRDAGVDLQNHGWSHTDHAALSARESAGEIHAGRDWLRRELDVDASYFAVPFGDVLPDPGVGSTCACWLTLYSQWPEGPIGTNTFNRLDPNLEATVAAHSSGGNRTAGPRWTWISRIIQLFRY